MFNSACTRRISPKLAAPWCSEGPLLVHQVVCWGLGGTGLASMALPWGRRKREQRDKQVYQYYKICARAGMQERGPSPNWGVP